MMEAKNESAVLYDIAQLKKRCRDLETQKREQVKLLAEMGKELKALKKNQQTLKKNQQTMIDLLAEEGMHI